MDIGTLIVPTYCLVLNNKYDINSGVWLNVNYRNNKYFIIYYIYI